MRDLFGSLSNGASRAEWVYLEPFSTQTMLPQQPVSVALYEARVIHFFLVDHHEKTSMSALQSGEPLIHVCGNPDLLSIWPGADDINEAHRQSLSVHVRQRRFFLSRSAP